MQGNTQLKWKTTRTFLPNIQEKLRKVYDKYITIQNLFYLLETSVFLRDVKSTGIFRIADNFDLKPWTPSSFRSSSQDLNQQEHCSRRVSFPLLFSSRILLLLSYPQIDLGDQLMAFIKGHGNDSQTALFQAEKEKYSNWSNCFSEGIHPLYLARKKKWLSSQRQKWTTSLKTQSRSKIRIENEWSFETKTDDQTGKFKNKINKISLKKMKKICSKYWIKKISRLLSSPRSKNVTFLTLKGNRFSISIILWFQFDFTNEVRMKVSLCFAFKTNT